MARYVISPDRSHVWIEARSNVHPIHSSTNGLEGYVELTLDPGGAVDLTSRTGRNALVVGRQAELRQADGGSRTPQADRLQALPHHRRGLTQIEPGEGQSTYRVTGNVTFRGVSLPHEDAWSSVGRRPHDQPRRRFPLRIREFGMQPPKVLMLKVEPEVDIRVEIFAVKEA